jgi:small subunit ribosomal protein S16
MATRIRLRRVGRKQQGSFRIIVAGSQHAQDGRLSETIGKYNPRTEPAYLEIDEKRALHWMRQGAELSESVAPLFRRAGILKKFSEGAEGEGVVKMGDPQGPTRRAAAGSGKSQKPAAQEGSAEG